MKKKKDSFAARAKKIISKYKRSSFDPTEKAELNAELEALNLEQEQYKRANKIGEYSDGNRKESSFYNGGPLTSTTAKEAESVRANSYIEPDVSTLAEQYVQPSVEGYPSEAYKTSIIPSLASGAISTIGNLSMANKAGDYDELKLPRLTAEQVSFAKEREAANRSNITSRNMTKRNIKGGARTRGELLTGFASSGAAHDKSLASTRGQSFQKEEILNAKERARVSAANANMMAQEANYNTNLKNMSTKEKQAYRAAALQNIPSMIKDINSIQQQDAMINSLGEDYGIYQEDYEGRKFYQPKKTVRKYKKTTK